MYIFGKLEAISLNFTELTTLTLLKMTSSSWASEARALAKMYSQVERKLRTEDTLDTIIKVGCIAFVVRGF
jgi:hypothetical protein